MSERTCHPWRCGNSCWGLPGCEHPERTPFYEIRLGILLHETTSHYRPFVVAMILCEAIIILTLWWTP